MPSRSNALHDRLPSGRDRLVQDFDNAEFFSGFEHRRFHRARDCDYQQIWIRVMEFLNQREPASRQRKIHQHNRESEALDHLKGLFSGRSQKHLPVAVQYLTGFFEDFWIVIDNKYHKRLLGDSRRQSNGLLENSEHSAFRRMMQSGS